MNSQSQQDDQRPAIVLRGVDEHGQPTAVTLATNSQLRDALGGMFLEGFAPTPEPRVTLDEIRAESWQSGYHTCTMVNRPINPPDKYDAWETMIAAGKSYLVGESMTTSQFLKRYTSPLLAWMKLAYRWARQNPGCYLEVDSSRLTRRGLWRTGGYFWQIGLRGDYVQFSLPLSACGGEKHWVSRDGKSRVLVNED